MARAHEIGFDLVGITDAAPFVHAQHVFHARVEAGLLGQWSYGSDAVRQRCTPTQTLDGARSIVCTATSYLTEDTPHDPHAPGLRGAVSRYAWGRDYHRVLRERLEELASFIRFEQPDARCVACVDTGPLVDRAAAVRAGIGWFGKNGNVLTRDFGSYVFLAELITDLELEPDVPLRKYCGSCAVCVERCPTGAISADGAVDARRCISDAMQLKGPIPRHLRKAIGNRVWGCDDCQTTCPVNVRKSTTASGRGDPSFRPLPHAGPSVDLPAMLHMTKSEFRGWFGPTAMAWRGKAVLQRNAAVALGNSRDRAAVPHLVAALADRKPLVRGHAAWALGELGGEDARAALTLLLESEPDAFVREEATLALRSAEASARAVA
ncbi:MAG: tRNA epoxyqueuosine(34) reductase QueG [Candidatus Eremiobacteraeota bacterium]|nr:tRNA epoxyqueuosine(34) reductase QueG [Candidatus Eremiobacteraeota bacterium]MBC5826454.1 tRNA epoxyqueuosine(34) reductase QueG [Candidatus Eremiobacteraeota bacterium]